MFTDKDLTCLIDLTGTQAMTNGWQIVIRAEWTDVTPQRPHGLSYALILQDNRGCRRLGFDNSHGFDGSSPDDRFDHEHPAARVNQRIRYDFVSAGTLVDDFFDRVEAYCNTHGIPYEFVDE